MSDCNVLAKVMHYYGLLSDEPNNVFKIRCPFHDDAKASLQIDLSEDRFYCFGCGKHGGPVEFIQAVAAIKKSKKVIHVFNDTNQFVRYRKGYKEAIRNAKLYFYSLPKTNWQGVHRNYMYKRGFTKQVLTDADVRINIGDADFGICAPLLDMGRFRGWVKRQTSNTPIKRGKYQYNTGFRRAQMLHGNYDKPWVVVTEGYMDRLKLQQFGVDNSVALLGWKASHHQIESILQYTDCVVSALDNTATGVRGTKFLRQYFNVVRFCFQDNTKDIGELDKYVFNRCWTKTIHKLNSKYNEGLTRKFWSNS